MIINYLVIGQCNQQCSFCLNPSLPEEVSLEKQLQLLHNLSEQRIKKIAFSGGEPLASRNIVRLIECAARLGMQVMLQTNGSLLTKQFLQKTGKNLTSVMVSLEGPEEVHNKLTGSNNFQKAVQSMKLIKEEEITLLSNFTITKQNLHCLDEYLDLLNSLKVDKACFTRLYPAGKASQNYHELAVSELQLVGFLKELQQKSSRLDIIIQGGLPLSFMQKHDISLPLGMCRAGISELAVLPDGSVVMCPSSQNVLGNVFNDLLESLIISQESFCNDQCLLFKT